MPIFYKVQHGNSIIEFSSENLAQDYATANNLAAPVSFERVLPDMTATNISNKIEENQKKAEKILREIYTLNTIEGITTEQSNSVFDDYQDVILRIREGAFPSAVARLQEKAPSGFVTQSIIDSWINIIQDNV